MTEETQEPEVLPASAQPIGRPVPPPAGRPWLPALICALFALGLAVAVAWWNTRAALEDVRAGLEARLAEAAEAQQESLRREAAALARVAAAEAAVAAADGRAAELAAGLGSTRGELRTLGETLRAQATRLAELEGGRPRAEAELAVAEGGRIIRAAGERLALDGDLATADALLASADARFVAAGDALFLPVREAIARDRTLLAGIEVPDYAGLALQLGEIERRVPGFTLAGRAGSVAADPSAAVPAPDAAESGTFAVALAAFWSDLRGLVEIRAEDPADELLLDPALPALVRERLRVELETARLAVLRRDQAAFGAALAAARALLTERFATDDPAVDGALAALGRMEAVVLRPVLPADLSAAAAADAAREALARQSRAAAEAPTPR